MGRGNIPRPFFYMMVAIMAQSVLHTADSRGVGNYDWLQAKYSFSFGGYYNPERVHFGMLRVINNDIIAPAMGFGSHPHDNMEIITIPLKGELRHRDNLGNTDVLRDGEVQVMSAGSGIVHAEFNASSENPIELLQIWIFPHTKNVEPRYEQTAFDVTKRANVWQELVGPKDKAQHLWINQDAWISIADLAPNNTVEYTVKRKGNGAYFFVIEGTPTIHNQQLESRDALGVWEQSDAIVCSNNAEKQTTILVLDVPMN